MDRDEIIQQAEAQAVRLEEREGISTVRRTALGALNVRRVADRRQKLRRATSATSGSQRIGEHQRPGEASGVSWVCIMVVGTIELSTLLVTKC